MNRALELAQDFEDADKAADAKVLRILEKAKADEALDQQASLVSEAETRCSDTQGDSAGHAAAPPTTAARDRTVPARSKRRGRTAARSQAEPATWGQPTALLNTRIPAQLADLLDDLVYRLKKQRRDNRSAVTKQALACEALEDLLRKYRVVK